MRLRSCNSWNLVFAFLWITKLGGFQGLGKGSVYPSCYCSCARSWACFNFSPQKSHRSIHTGSVSPLILGLWLPPGSQIWITIPFGHHGKGGVAWVLGGAWSLGLDMLIHGWRQRQLQRQLLSDTATISIKVEATHFFSKSCPLLKCVWRISSLLWSSWRESITTV